MGLQTDAPLKRSIKPLGQCWVVLDCLVRLFVPSLSPPAPPWWHSSSSSHSEVVACNGAGVLTTST